MPVDRIPTIVVLGHVDHGKTTLLDAIRKTDVQKREPMGITQNIYISEVEYQGKTLTFVDTPGHEVFSLMRMQGGRVADLALLVVAADEGVQEQTKESLEIIKKEGIKFIVAITKIDTEGANVQKVINDLLKEGVYLEGYGGDVPYVEVSGVTGQGLDKLLETIFLYIEVENLLDDDFAKLKLEEFIKDKDLITNIDGYGVVLDTTVDPHLGVTAFVIWRLGKITYKDVVFLQNTRVRLSKFQNANKEPIKEAIAGKAVIIPSVDVLPNPGDLLLYSKNSRKLEKALERFYKDQKLLSSARAVSKEAQKDFLEEFFSDQEEVVEKTIVPLIIKFDVEASKRSILPTLERFNTEHVEFKVISSGVGNVSPNDIDLAKEFKAKVIAFRVKVQNKVESIAKKLKIDVQRFDTVYQFYEFLREVAEKIEEKYQGPQVIGKARVLKVFVLSDNSVVAGSAVLEGVVKRSARVRVVRNDKTVAEYDIVDLRRFKEKVAEVTKGSECGINLGKKADIKEGDILEIIEK